jgi:exosortase/archaeosortase
MTLSEFLDAFHNVWTTSALATAIVGGSVVGAVIATMARVPRTDNARNVALIVIAAAALFASVFWTGQLADAFFGGDPNWPRALARAVLQMLYGLFVGLGFYAGVVIERRR